MPAYACGFCGTRHQQRHEALLGAATPKVDKSTDTSNFESKESGMDTGGRRDPHSTDRVAIDDEQRIAPALPPRPKTPQHRTMRARPVPRLFHMLCIVPEIASFLSATNFDGTRWLGRLRFVSKDFDSFRIQSFWNKVEAPEEKLWSPFEDMLRIVGHNVRVLDLTNVTESARLADLLRLCPEIHTFTLKVSSVGHPVAQATAHDRANDSDRVRVPALPRSSSRRRSARRRSRARVPVRPPPSPALLEASTEIDAFFNILAARARRSPRIAAASSASQQTEESPGAAGGGRQTPLRNVVLLGYPSLDTNRQFLFLEALVNFIVQNFEHFHSIIIRSDAASQVLLQVLAQAQQDADGRAVVAEGGVSQSAAESARRAQQGRLILMCLESFIEGYCTNLHSHLRSNPNVQLIVRVAHTFEKTNPEIIPSILRVLSVLASKHMVSTPEIEKSLVHLFLHYMGEIEIDSRYKSSASRSKAHLTQRPFSSLTLLKMCLWTFLKIISRTIGDAFSHHSMSKGILRQFVRNSGPQVLIRLLRMLGTFSVEALKASVDESKWESPTHIVETAAADEPYRSYTRNGTFGTSDSGVTGTTLRPSDPDLQKCRNSQQIYRCGFALLNLVHDQIDKVLTEGFDTEEAVHAEESKASHTNTNNFETLRNDIVDFIKEQTMLAFCDGPQTVTGSDQVPCSYLLNIDPHVRYHAGCIVRGIPSFTDKGACLPWSE